MSTFKLGYAMFRSLFGSSQADHAPAQQPQESEQPQEPDFDTWDFESRLLSLQEEINNKDKRLQENDHSLQRLIEHLKIQIMCRENYNPRDPMFLHSLQLELMCLRRIGLQLDSLHEGTMLYSPKVVRLTRVLGLEFKRLSSAKARLQDEVNELQEKVRLLEMEPRRAESSLLPFRRLLDVIQRELSCCRCMNLCWEPLVIVPCGHLFCGQCVHTHFELPGQRLCPSCRTPNSIFTAPIPIWTIKALVEQIKQNKELIEELRIN